MDKLRKRWWKLDGDELCGAIFDAVKAAIGVGEGSSRRELLDAWRRLYVDSSDKTFNWEKFGLYRDRKSRIPALRSAVDTAVAKLTKNRPKPQVITTRGNWNAYRRAQLLTSWLAGEISRLKMYEIGEQLVLDSAVYGTGVLHFYEKNGRPAVERVWCGDMHVDPREERLGCVRTLYRTSGIDREVLAEMFPQHEDLIMQSERYEDHSTEGLPDSYAADLVEVVEAWRLPAAEKPEDWDEEKRWPGAGRHAICIKGGVLDDDVWEENEFPFEFLPWSIDPQRFWGVGLVEIGSGMQSSLNASSAKIEDAFDLSVPLIIWESSSKFEIKKMKNVNWKGYSYQGNIPPQFIAPPAIGRDQTEREEIKIGRIYNMLGVSEMEAQAIKPTGIDSGKGLRTLHDIGTERFFPQGRRYERLFTNGSKHLVRIAEEIVERDEASAEKLTVMAGGKRMLDLIKYADARMGDEPHMIDVLPVSALSGSVEGKIANVQDLWNLGAIPDVDSLRELLDMPDLERFGERQSGGRNMVEQVIDHALRGTVHEVHWPYLPVEHAHKQVVLALNEAEMNGAPESVLAALRDVEGQVNDALQKKKAAEAAMMQPPPQGAPPGPVGAPPGLAA